MFFLKAYGEYEEWLSRLVAALDLIMDSKSIDLNFPGSMMENLKSIMAFVKSGFRLRHDISSFYDLMTSPASKLLDQFFESEPLKVDI